MTRILALDTSSEACSAALLTPDGLAEDFRLSPREHTRLILPMVDDLLRTAGLRLVDLDAIAFAQGPGSFTGLRIVVGVVQGLAWGAQLPVVGVSTLAALALAAAQQQKCEWVLPLLDARMDEVYAGLYRIEAGLPVLQGSERVCGAEQLIDLVPAGESRLAVVGSGLTYEARFPSQLEQRIGHRDASLQPRAAQVALLAEPLLRAGQVLSADAVQPVYLRDEVAWNKLPGR